MMGSKYYMFLLKFRQFWRLIGAKAGNTGSDGFEVGAVNGNGSSWDQNGSM